MCGPEEWPSCRGDPADRIRLTGPAANTPSFSRYSLMNVGLRKFQLTPKENCVRTNMRAQAERCQTLIAPTARKFLKKHFPNDFKPPSHAPQRGTAPQTVN